MKHVFNLIAALVLFAARPAFAQYQNPRYPAPAQQPVLVREYYAPAPAPAYSRPGYSASPAIPPYDEYGRPNPDAFEWTGFSLGGNIGTLGLGMDATFYMADWVNFRAGPKVFMITYKDTLNKVDFDFDWQFLGAILTFDFYPGQMRNFRISLGSGLDSSEVDIDGTPRSGAGVGRVSGDASYSLFAPYVGIGFGNTVQPDSAWSFVFDIGLLFQSYDLSLKVAPGSGGAAAASDIKSEVEDTLDKITMYPVITFGVAYHF